MLPSLAARDLLVLAVRALAAAPAALTPVVNPDTLAYRLPRNAAWMHEGRVGHFAAFDGAAYLWQLLEPSSNPPLVAGLSGGACAALGTLRAAGALLRGRAPADAFLVALALPVALLP